MGVCDNLPPELLADTGHEDGNIWWPCDRENPTRDNIPTGSRRREFWPHGGVAYWRAGREVEIVLPGTVEHVLTHVLRRDGRWFIGGTVRSCAVEWRKDGWGLVWRDDNVLPPDDERGLTDDPYNLRIQSRTT